MGLFFLKKNNLEVVQIEILSSSGGVTSIKLDFKHLFFGCEVNENCQLSVLGRILIHS